MSRVSQVGRKGFYAYALATLVLVGGGTVVAGGNQALVAGMFTAWVVQLVAFRPLASALAEKRDMTRAWLGGLALRAAGLMATGGLTVAGLASSDLPVAYGTTMLVLLLAEAGWLFRRLSRPDTADGETGGSTNGIERTSTTG